MGSRWKMKKEKREKPHLSQAEAHTGSPDSPFPCQSPKRLRSHSNNSSSQLRPMLSKPVSKHREADFMPRKRSTGNKKFSHRKCNTEEFVHFKTRIQNNPSLGWVDLPVASIGGAEHSQHE